MIVTQAIFDDLTRRAQDSPRLRMVMDLRNTPEDDSQRLLNAIEPGSVVPIHRHRNTSETIVCLRGELVVEFYDELERICAESVVLKPNGNAIAVDVPIGQWHSVYAIQSGTVILETKNGIYEPIREDDLLKK